jgi:hypothetical protein
VTTLLQAAAPIPPHLPTLVCRALLLPLPFLADLLLLLLLTVASSALATTPTCEAPPPWHCHCS